MSTDNATKTDLLSLQDRLNRLDAMADNPWKYKAADWDEAYAEAQYEARACKGMAMGAQAHDIAVRFKRAGKRFHACAALNLVPAEKAVSFSMDVRVAKPGDIGPGYPEPPPPPPTKAIGAADIHNAWEQCDRRVGMSISHELAAELAARLNRAMGIKAP